MCTKKNTLYIKTITSLFQVTGKAPVRAYHSCTVVNEELLIFGGVFPNPDPIPDGCSNDVHFFSTGRCLPCLTLLRIFFVTCVWRNTLLSPQYFVSGWSPVIGFYPCLIENRTTFIFPDIFLSGGNVAKYWGGAGNVAKYWGGAVTLLFQLESTVYCLFLSFSNKRIGGDRTPSRSKCPPLIFLQIPNLMLFIQHYHQIIPLLNLNKLVALGLNLGHLHNNSTSLYLNSPKLAGWIRISTNYE